MAPNDDADARTLVELAEGGGLHRGGRAAAMAAAIRHGLAAARAVPSRRWTFVAWALFGAALGAWVLGVMRQHVAPLGWWIAVVAQSAWFALAAAIGYVHLELVRRDDGTPRRSFLIPNGLTLNRFTLAPLLGFAAAHALALREHADLVLWPLVYVVASDLFDGQIARFFRMRSEWGRLADPFADIFTACAFAAGLWAGGFLAPWLGALIVFRYGGTLIAVFVIWSRGRSVRVAPTWPGRAANLAVDFYLPALFAAALRWPSWLQSEWLLWVYRATAALVVINVGYLAVRLVLALRPRGEARAGS